MVGWNIGVENYTEHLKSSDKKITKIASFLLP